MKLISIIIITSLFLSSCGNETEQKVQKYYSTGSVFSGSISLNNSYIGYIQGEKTVKLSSKIGGKIEDIYVKEGDYVKKGALIAILDSSETNAGYKSSSNIIETLNTTKESTKELFDEQINQLKAKIRQINNSKLLSDNNIIDTDNIAKAKLNTLQNSIDIAKTNLEHTKKILNTKEENIYKNSKDAIVGAIILDTNIIDFTDFLLGVTEKNKNKNNDFEIYLSAKNINYLKEAKNSFIEVNKKYLEFKDFYNNEIDGKNPDKKTILKGLKDGESLAENFKTLLSIIYNVLDNSIDNVNFTLTTINNYKNTISTFGNNIEINLLSISGPYIMGLKGSYQNLRNFEEEKNMQIDLLEKQLLLAKNNYNEYIALNKSQKNNVKTKSEIAKEQVNEINSSLKALIKQKEVSLNEIQAKIDEIRGKKNLEGVMINNAKIFSPINGIVTKKMSEIGKVVGAGIPILEISSNENLKINIYVNEENLNNKNLFDDVTIEINGIEKQIFGKITNIVKSKNPITKKTKIEISLKNKGNDIKIGTTAKITFNEKSHNNGIIISNKAIISKFMIPGVYVLKKNKVKFKNIKIIKQNNDFSQVSGVKVGDIIIINGKENILDGEILNN